MQVFLQTNAFKLDDPQYHPTATVKLGTTSDDSMRLTGAALSGLRRIYKPGFRYVKAGVMLNDIRPATIQQLSLFDVSAPSPTAQAGARSKLMSVMDSINRAEGKGTLQLASAGIHNTWAMKRENMSPAYTTRWDELAVAVA